MDIKVVTAGIEHRVQDAVIEIDGHIYLLYGEPYRRSSKVRDQEVHVSGGDTSKWARMNRRDIESELLHHFWDEHGDEYGISHNRSDPVYSAVEWLFYHFLPDYNARAATPISYHLLYAEDEYRPERWNFVTEDDEILTTEGVRHLMQDAIIEIDGHKLVIFYGGGAVRACDRSDEARRLRSLIQADMLRNSNLSGYDGGPDPSGWEAEKALAKYGKEHTVRMVYDMPMQDYDQDIDY